MTETAFWERVLLQLLRNAIYAIVELDEELSIEVSCLLVQSKSITSGEFAFVAFVSIAEPPVLSFASLDLLLLPRWFLVSGLSSKVPSEMASVSV